MKRLLLILTLIPMYTQASEAECLAKIMYSEANGEPIEGVVAVGHASLNRSKITNRSICKIKGVTKRTVHPRVHNTYIALAKSVLNGDKSVVGKADSWERKINPNKGKITRRIGHHTFYVMRGLK